MIHCCKTFLRLFARVCQVQQAAVATFGCLLALSASSLQGQGISGVIRDSLSGTPIADVQVSLLTEHGVVLTFTRTTRAGTFRVSPKKSGTYAVFARKLGFEPTRSEFLTLGTDDSVATNLLMKKIPQFLPDVAIRQERNAIMNEKFYGMKISTLGATVVSPTQVDEALPGARNVLDLLNRNPGAGISVDQERKCVLSLRGYPPTCLPVIVDGLLVSTEGDIEDAVSAEVVDYILVLRGNETGVLFGSVGEKGVLVIFTKKGLKRGPR